MSIFELPLFYRALAAGLIVALLAGTLGVMVVLRRMAFFSDAIAHASLTGIALGLLLQLEPLLSAIGFSVLVSIGIAILSRKNTLALDTIIGVFYSAAVALGVIIINGLSGIRVNLEGFLFGDILAITSQDLIVAAVLAIVVLVGFALLFNALVQLALSKEMAKVHGIRVDLNEFIFMVLLALTVAIGIKLVGIILIGPLLIMPAATAKNMSRSLVGMLGTSIVVALVGVVIGFLASVFLNTPTGPTIVLAMAVLFAGSLIVRSVRAP
jgi:zinc transport system permease protein